MDMAQLDESPFLVCLTMFHIRVEHGLEYWSEFLFLEYLVPVSGILSNKY